VKDAAAFAAAYPGVPIAGVFGGALDNAGDTLTLRDLAENIIFSVTYWDSNVPGWPADPDGEGSTLVLRRQFSPSTDPALPASWRASTGAGAPGSPDSVAFSGVALADLDGDGYPALVEHALGTSDTNGNSLPVVEITRDANGHAVVRFTHPIGADDVTISAIQSDTLSGGTAATWMSTIDDDPGWMQSAWQSTATGPKSFMWLKVTLLP
jgi:hypothetical protein